MKAVGEVGRAARALAVLDSAHGLDVGDDMESDVRLVGVPGPGEVHYLTLKLGPVALRFIRRPMTTPATEGQIAFLDGVDLNGRPRRDVGVYREGEWWGGKGHAALRFTPQMWTVCGEMDRTHDGG